MRLSIARVSVVPATMWARAVLSLLPRPLRELVLRRLASPTTARFGTLPHTCIRLLILVVFEADLLSASSDLTALRLAVRTALLGMHVLRRSCV